MPVVRYPGGMMKRPPLTAGLSSAHLEGSELLEAAQSCDPFLVELDIKGGGRFLGVLRKEEDEERSGVRKGPG